MDPKIVWLFIFVILYWGYCIFQGIKGAIAAKTACDYMVAGRSIPLWVFVLAATATSFSGWTFVLITGIIAYHGISYRDIEGERELVHLLFGCIALFYGIWVLGRDILGVL